MTECNSQPIVFSSLGRRNVVADFTGGAITSDSGALLLREIDRKLGLIDKLDAVIPDPRNQALITHQQSTMLRQRIFAIAMGYEDGNDHQSLRDDPLMQLITERGIDAQQPLASPPTLCRLENRVSRTTLAKIAKVFVEAFIALHKTPPKELVLDFDATDDSVHGHQVNRFFHGYYDQYCFLPLYVFCGHHLLVSYLRPANIDAATHSWAILGLLVKRFRQIWPKENHRFVVTNLPGDGRWLYEQLYCKRGDAENRIKEQQLGLFADRTSCHQFVPNQFRVMLSAVAYVLLQSLRQTALIGTELAEAQVTTIRLKLLKVGGLIKRSARRIVLHLAGGYPSQQLFRLIARRLISLPNTA